MKFAEQIFCRPLKWKLHATLRGPQIKKKKSFALFDGDDDDDNVNNRENVINVDINHEKM